MSNIYVLGQGQHNAEVMVVNGIIESSAVEFGLPFTISKKNIIKEHLQKLGLALSSVYCTNLVKAFRAGHSADKLCANFGPTLDKEVSRVKPSIVITFGGLAANYLLDYEIDLSTACGIPHPLKDGTILVPFNSLSHIKLVDRNVVEVQHTKHALGKLRQAGFIKGAL